MSSPLRVLSSSIGRKILIGATGIGLVVYLLIHVTANLTIFGGVETFNLTADRLEHLPLLRVVEIGLLIVFLLHIVSTIDMFLENRKARPVGYAQKKPAGPPSRKTPASTTMILSGLWLLVFLIIHVKQFRFSPMYEWGQEGARDFYRLEMDNLRHPAMAAFYVLSMLLLGSHLSHGISSAFQSLGLDSKRYTPAVLVGGKILAVLIALAFSAITIWVYMTGRA